MKAKFNPSGTHLHNGKLKVRIDLYPSAMNKVYGQHYVDKPIRPYTEEELGNEALRALVPTRKELNPCLCHFIQVDENITGQTLVTYIRSIFSKETLLELDAALDKNNRSRVSRLMGNKVGSSKLVQGITNKKLNALNTRLSGLEVEV